MANSAKHFQDSLLRRGLALRVEGELDPALAIQPNRRGEIDQVQRNGVFAAVVGYVVEIVTLHPIVGQPVHPAVFKLQQGDSAIGTECRGIAWGRA